MKPKTLVDYILWIMWIGLAFIALVLAIGIQNSEIQDIGPLISALAILLSAAVASTSIMKNIAETKANEVKKHQKEDSKFHLDKCSEGLKTFFELLKDGNNNREIWIEASRTLLIVLNLSKNITESHHKDFFELEKSKYRHHLYTIFNQIFTENKSNAHLFFTGIKGWENSNDTLENILGNHFYHDDIDPESVIAIFSFLDYPENYSDPLDDQRVDFSSFNTRKWPAEPQKYAARYLSYFQKDPQ